MAKAILLLIGAAVYLGVTHFAYDTASAQTVGIKNLYTSAQAQANAISAANR